jgi:protein-S-isoprenylcysteine O-methyltransferase Ste14
MHQASSLLTSRPANLAGSLLLAALWSAFALAHISAWHSGGNWTYLLFCGAETLGALLFLLRTMPVAVSSHAGDWLASMGGTFGVFLFTPTESALLPEATLLVAVGCLLQIGGLLSLNRSFGLVAARREIKTGGLYRVVRHPLYASYLLSFTGYALSNSSWGNLAVASGVMLLLLVRLVREERLLRQDAAYRAYMRQVPYRLIPLIF